MPSKKTLCQNWKLYAITSEDLVPGNSLEEAVMRAIDGGADVIQLRNKKASDEALLTEARKILRITRSRNIPLIINDRINVAKAAGADGVHLGQDDGVLAEARRILGNDNIIGRSTHSPQQALVAQEEGFDYIGVGPVFATPTKADYVPVGLDLVTFAAKNIKIPFVAIGGINENNVKEVLCAGAKTIAVVRAVLGAQDPKLQARKLKLLMEGRPN